MFVFVLLCVAGVLFWCAVKIGFSRDAVRAGFLLALLLPILAGLYGAIWAVLREQVPPLLVATTLMMGALNFWVFSMLGGRLR